MQSSYMNGSALVKYTLGLMLPPTPQSVALALALPPQIKTKRNYGVNLALYPKRQSDVMFNPLQSIASRIATKF